MQAGAESRRRTALRQCACAVLHRPASARRLPSSWRMSDPTIDSRSRPPQGGRAIVVLLVDDQPFVGAALGVLLESEPDIELHSCLTAVDAIAMANKIAPTLILQDLV